MPLEEFVNSVGLVIELPEWKDKYLADLIDRNNYIIIEKHRSEMQNYQDGKVRHIYNWAKINGYDKTWKPEGRKVTV